MDYKNIISPMEFLNESRRPIEAHKVSRSTKKICGELQGKVTITSGNTTTYYLSFSSAEKALNALGASITWNK